MLWRCYSQQPKVRSNPSTHSALFGELPMSNKITERKPLWVTNHSRASQEVQW